jgi:hypothetical protein
MDITASGSAWLRRRSDQFSILTRHFFGRFFQNDVVAFEDQAKEKVIAGLAFLAILGVQISNSFLFKYAFMVEEGPSWVDKCFFIWFFMLLLGFLAVVEWDVIFPDRRDYLSITPLPVKIRTIFLAKSASFFLIIGLFSLAANIGASLVFGFYLSHYRSSSPLFILRYAAAHLLSASAANIFLFFSCALVQGLLMSLLGHGLYRSVSFLARFLLLTAFVFLLIFSVAGPLILPHFLPDLTWTGGAQNLLRWTFPPMWFTGLYERLLGNPDPFFATLARYALLSVLLPILGFFATAWMGYGRHLKKSLEAKRSRVAIIKFRDSISRPFDAVFVRNRTQRAIYHFFGQTLSRSSLHKMRLFSYLAVSSGLVLILLASTQLLRRYLTIFNKTLLSIPLILSFFLLLGIRALTNLPSSLEANWVFQMTERGPRRHYFSGFKKRILVSALLPLFVLVFGSSFYLWGWKIALLHSLFGLAASILLMEFLFFGYPKIPFACTYVPGKAKLHLFWLIYVIAFVIYISFLSALETFLFRYPRYFINYFIILGLGFAAVRVYENLLIYRTQPILYEDRPEPVMISLESAP